MSKEYLESLLHYYLVPILFVLLIFLVLMLVYNRLKYAYIFYKKRVYYPKITEKLTELTFLGLQGKALKKEVKQIKSQFPYHKKWFRNLLLSAIIDLSLNLKGDLIYQVRDIYMTFGLHKYSLKLIKSRYWYIKCVGIYHFQSLNFVHGQKYIKPYISSNNEILRSNAFIAHLYLTKEPFDFLVDYPFPISNVNEYKVIDVFYMKKEPIPKNIAEWLDAKNESIVILGLKVMVFYNDTASSKRIIELLCHSKFRIRQEAILSCHELFLIDAEEPLQKKFDFEKKPLKIEVIKSLAAIGGESTVSFISKELIRKDIDKDIKMELLKCLKVVDANYFNTRFMLDLEIERMKAHINSALI